MAFVIKIRQVVAGNSIAGLNRRNYGIFLDSATLDTGWGNDLLRGSISESGASGSGIFAQGGSNLFTSLGNDSIIGEGFGAGIVLFSSKLNSGEGDDVILGTSTASGHVTFNGGDLVAGSGVYVWKGELNTEGGNDLITGIGSGIYGISLKVNANLFTGDGDDSVSGTGNLTGIVVSYDSALDAGPGNDSISGIGPESGVYGWSSRIDMGDGEDTLTGINTAGGSSNLPSAGTGIFIFDSIVNTGAENDIVDATEGGFGGGGILQLGAGDDIAKGFGRVSLDGGTGADQLILNDGVWTITDTFGGFRINQSGTTMRVTGIELIGNGSEIVNLKAGTLTILDGNVSLI